MDQVEKIVRSDLPDVEKLVRAFDEIAGRVVDAAEREIEVARALQDRDAVVKEQIKMETIRHAQSIVDDCYMMITRRRRGDD